MTMHEVLAQMNTHVFAAGWLFMFLLILVVFGVIVAIIWRSWAVGGIVLALVIVIGAFMVFFLRGVDVATPAATIVYEETSSSGDPWEPTAEQLQTADLFASYEDGAVAALATPVRDQMQQRLKSTQVSQIRIDAMNSPVFFEDIKTVFKEGFPGVDVIMIDSEKPPAADPAALTVVAKSQAVQGAMTWTWRMTADRGPIHAEKTIRVADKKWVNHLSEFLGQRADRDWLVGRSSTAATSKEAARQQARRDAARQLAPLVTARYPQRSSNPPGTNHRWLEDQLESRLIQGYIQDDFVQGVQLGLSGRRGYRAAVLVTSSPSALDRLNESISGESRYRHTRMRRGGFGIVGLGILICFIYLFLNRATRGYFQMNLRLAATLVLIAGVLLILLIT